MLTKAVLLGSQTTMCVCGGGTPTSWAAGGVTDADMQVWVGGAERKYAESP